MEPQMWTKKSSKLSNSCKKSFCFPPTIENLLHSVYDFFIAIFLCSTKCLRSDIAQKIWNFNLKNWYKWRWQKINNFMAMKLITRLTNIYWNSGREKRALRMTNKDLIELFCWSIRRTKRIFINKTKMH